MPSTPDFEDRLFRILEDVLLRHLPLGPAHSEACMSAMERALDAIAAREAAEAACPSHHGSGPGTRDNP